jgi:hypothetical protein
MNRLKPHSRSSSRSPFAGCALLVAALLVICLLIGFSIFSLFRQFNEIVKFTAESPAAVEVSSLDANEGALNRLAERLESFRQQLADRERAELALSAEDLNRIIAAYEACRDLRGTLRVTAMDGTAMKIAVAFPLNGKPRLAHKDEPGWITSTPRYLNAQLVARPALRKGELVLLLDAIDVPGASVPREFIDQMSPYRITQRYLTDPVLGPCMAALTEVHLAGDQLVLTHVPSQAPPKTLGKKLINHASRRLFLVLGMAAVAFLCLVALIVFFSRRRRAKRSSSDSPPFL